MINLKKRDLYRWIKIAGILSFIPFILAAGPLAGFFAAGFLETRFGLPQYTTIILVTIGLIGSARETVRIIKIALRSEEKDDAA